MTTPPVPRTLTTTVAALALVLAGCGIGADEGGDGGADDQAAGAPTTAPASSPSSGPAASAPEPEDPSPSEADPQARRELKAAIIGLVRRNSGRYRVVVPLGAGYTIRESGRYRIKPPAFETTRVIGAPEGAVRVVYRSVGGRLWFRVERSSSDDGGSAGWPCWVDQAAMARLSDAAAVDLGQAAAGQPPAALIAASWGTGWSSDGDGRIDGTTDLATTLGLVSAKFLVAAGVDPQADDVVPASFTVRDGLLTGYEVSLADLPDAIEAGGSELPEELYDLGTLPGAITSRFVDIGAQVEVQAPPVGQRLRFRSAADFEAAMRSCGDG